MKARVLTLAFVTALPAAFAFQAVAHQLSASAPAMASDLVQSAPVPAAPLGSLIIANNEATPAASVAPSNNGLFTPTVVTVQSN